MCNYWNEATGCMTSSQYAMNSVIETVAFYAVPVVLLAVAAVCAWKAARG